MNSRAEFDKRQLHYVFARRTTAVCGSWSPRSRRETGLELSANAIYESAAVVGGVDPALDWLVQPRREP